VMPIISPDLLRFARPLGGKAVNSIVKSPELPIKTPAVGRGVV